MFMCQIYVQNLTAFDNSHALLHSNLVTSLHPVFNDYTAINKTFVLPLFTDPYGMLNYSICLHKIGIRIVKKWNVLETTNHFHSAHRLCVC